MALVVWAPQKGPQAAFVACPYEEIFFGGARGGGKTDAAIGRALLRAIKFGKAYRGVFIRRELTQLAPAISRSKEIYSGFGVYNESKKIWTFNGGGELMFRYIERDADADKLQGENFSDINIEEIGNFPALEPLLKLKGALRSRSGVPVSWVATGNPGGVGQSAIRKRYIDPAPQGWTPIRERDPLTGTVSERIFIPSRITDNALLLKNDPGYLARLAQTGSEQLVRAWIDGDFTQIEGAFFPEFSIETHVVSAVALPQHWFRFRAADFGSYYPAACLWMAVASEDWRHPGGKPIPRGSIIVTRELYTTQNGGNRGEKLTAEEFGRLVAINDGAEKISDAVLDPANFKQDGGPSIAERIMRSTNGKVTFRRADNRRVGTDGAVGGWDALRARLRGEPDKHGIVRPTLYIMDACKHLIRTIPDAQHDPDHPEDMMLTEDHLLDALRYGVMSRPRRANLPERGKVSRDLASGASLNDLWRDRERSRGKELHWQV